MMTMIFYFGIFQFILLLSNHLYKIYIFLKNFNYIIYFTILNIYL